MLNTCFFVHEYRVLVNKYLTRINVEQSPIGGDRRMFRQGFYRVGAKLQVFFGENGRLSKNIFGILNLHRRGKSFFD